MSKFNLLLANYLNEIEYELRYLPASAREDELREIQAHLGALVLAGQQLEDLSADAATATALRQFGAPRQIGRKLRKAWERAQPEAWWRAGLALAFALGFYVVGAFPFMQGFYRGFCNFYGVDSTVPAADAHAIAIYQTIAVCSQFFGFFFMMFATYVMGLISPKRCKLVIAAILICLFAAMIFQSYPNTSVFVLLLAVNLITAASVGTFLGARHGRRLLSRLARTR